jgi:phosphodiesterase/alkaline phosphatase D-like protein
MTRRMIVGLVVAWAAAVAAPGSALAATPSTVTGSAGAITQTGATLHGTVNPEGAATTYYFQVGLTTVYGITTAIKSAGSGTKSVSVSDAVTGLAPATVYHYRIVAQSLQGTATGTDRTFTTKGPPAPSPVTGGALSIGRYGATVTGTVATQGVATSWAFQYGLTTAYGVTTTGGTVLPSATPVAVSQVLAGLEPGVTFHYRLIASRGALPPSVGADQTFFTFPAPRLHTRVRARTLPVIAASKPYVFTTRGSIVSPSALPPRIACNGRVTVRFLLAGRSVAARSAAVQPDCRFSSSITFHKLIHGVAQNLRVTVRFRGNNYLLPQLARAQGVRLGL